MSVRAKVTKSLLQLYRDAALGRFPPTGSGITLLPSPPGPAPAAILALTAHHVVAADVSPSWIVETPDRGLAAAMSPSFIVALEQELGLHADSVDVLLAAHGRGGSPSTAANESRFRVRSGSECRSITISAKTATLRKHAGSERLSPFRAQRRVFRRARGRSRRPECFLPTGCGPAAAVLSLSLRDNDRAAR